MTTDDYADRLERRITALQEEAAVLRADLSRAVRDRAVLLEACQEMRSALDRYGFATIDSLFGQDEKFVAADEKLEAAIRTVTEK